MEWYVIVILVIVGLLLLSLLLLFGAGFIVWNIAIPAKKNKKEKKEEVDQTWVEMAKYMKDVTSKLEAMNMEEVWIKSFDGLNLHGYYKEAACPTNRTIISVHGHKGSALGTAPIFSHFLTDFNYNILFIDLRSSGESEGKYITFGSLDSKDLLKWIDYLKDRSSNDVEIALFGISMGGNTVINVADKVPKEVKCIIDDCGYTTTWDQFAHILKNQMHLPVFILYFAELINKMVAKFGFRNPDGRKALSASRVPVLFIHGDEDDYVPTSMGKENYDACTSAKEMKLFEGAGHAKCFFMYQEAYKKTVLDFLAKYL